MFFVHVSKVPDWRCRGCVVIIIMMTVGDAEDARRWLSSVMMTVMMRLEMQRVRSHH